MVGEEKREFMDMDSGWFKKQQSDFQSLKQNKALVFNIFRYCAHLYNKNCSLMVLKLQVYLWYLPKIDILIQAQGFTFKSNPCDSERKWPRESILRNTTLYQLAGLRRGLSFPSLLWGFSLIADFIFCITPHCPTLYSLLLGKCYFLSSEFIFGMHFI